MEESDSGQQMRCRCGFWGSTKTLGLCSKCYKEHEEQSKEALDPKAELMRNTDHSRPNQFSGREPLNAGPSSYSSSSRNTGTTGSSRQTSATMEKAEKMIKQAIIQNQMDLNSNTNANGKKAEESKNSAESKVCEDSNPSTSKSDSVSAVVKSEDSVESVTSDPACSKSDMTSNEENRGVKRDSSALDGESTPEKAGTKSRKKCAMCKVKLELAQRALGKCRCDNVYCSLHRLPEQHHCDFDHKEDGRREAREKMVKPTRHLGTSFKRLDSDS